MNILVLPGDGIGPEITEATVAVLTAADRRFGLDIALEYDEVGFAALKTHGSTCPDALIDRAKAADGIILGSPVYFSCMTPEIKALIDRAGMVSRANGMQLRRKVGAAVVAARRAGSVHTFDSINHFWRRSSSAARPSSAQGNGPASGPRRPSSPGRRWTGG